MHGVEAFGLRLREAHHAGGDDAQAGLLEAAVDLADDVLADTIGLDDGEGAFDGHADPLAGATSPVTDVEHDPDDPDPRGRGPGQGQPWKSERASIRAAGAAANENSAAAGS